jgi:hypothetical protein
MVIMKNVPIRGILMFSLIIIGIVLFVFSIYLLAFIIRIPYWFGGHVASTGFFLIYYAFFDERRNLIISSLLLGSLILDMFIIILFSSFYNAVFYWYTVPDRGWMYALMPVVLIALVITFVLHLFKESRT